jgi:hypothetical protein
MKNPIGNVGLFATPKSMKDLEDYLSMFNGSEGTVAWTGAMMAWNLAGKYVDENLKSEAAEKAALNYNTPAAYRARMNGGA